MTVRRAEPRDTAAIHRLLRQVLELHHRGRPDLFYGGTTKYTDEELLSIMANKSRPIFIAEEESTVLGYAFCVLEDPPVGHILTDIKTLYIDDICVDEANRGKHVGKTLYEHVKRFAMEMDCRRITLNVWSCNPAALAFYEKMGMSPYKICMEALL